jgi:type I restriction enzyme, R subunit
LAGQLKHAMVTYTERGGKGDPTFDTKQAIALMMKKHGIACDMMHGFVWNNRTIGKHADHSPFL